MSILLETTFGDLVIDLDIEGSPALAKNFLKLVAARYYTNTLIYNVVPGKYSQMGDPKGDGTGGCSIYGLIDSYQSLPSSTKSKTSIPPPPDVTTSQRRFLQSHGRHLNSSELNQKGVVIAMEMGNVAHTIGSQFLITLSENNGLNDLVPVDFEEMTHNRDRDNNLDDKGGKLRSHKYLSLGNVAEDSQHVLSKLNRAYCDDDGRPFADIRIQRILVIHDPFDDPPGMVDLLKWRGVNASDEKDNGEKSDKNDFKGYPLAPQSPGYERPPEETVAIRIQADDTTLFATAGWDDEESISQLPNDDDEDEEAKQKRQELQKKQEEEWKKKQDTSRAVMLEMLGDLPSADIQAPENVLFVCKLNPLTNDEDLELIFSRFDSNAKAEIIRDPDTGASLQYAFVEFSTKESCNEAYLKMNNALVDDRRIRVDFSQSVAKVWDRYHKRYRNGLGGGVDRGFLDGGNSGRGQGSRGGGKLRVGRVGEGGGRSYEKGKLQYHKYSNRPFPLNMGNSRENIRHDRPNPIEHRGQKEDQRSTVIDDKKRNDSYEIPDDYRYARQYSRHYRSHGHSHDHSMSSDSDRHRRSRSRSTRNDHRRLRRSRSRCRSRSRSNDRHRSRREKNHKKKDRRERSDRSNSNDCEKKRKKKYRCSNHSDEGRKRSRNHHTSHSRNRSEGQRCERKRSSHRHR